MFTKGFKKSSVNIFEIEEFASRQNRLQIVIKQLTTTPTPPHPPVSPPGFIILS